MSKPDRRKTYVDPSTPDADAPIKEPVGVVRESPPGVNGNHVAVQTGAIKMLT